MSGFREQSMAVATTPAALPIGTYQGRSIADLAQPMPTAPSELELARAALAEEQAACTALQQRLQQGTQMLADAVQQVGQVLTQFQDEAPRELAEVALLIAERVIEREVTTNPDVLLQCAQRVLQASRPFGEARLGFHPADLELLRTTAAASLQSLEGQSALAIAADDTLPSGVCRLEAAGYRIEENLPRRLAAIWTEVTAALQASSPETTEAPTA